MVALLKNVSLCSEYLSFFNVSTLFLTPVNIFTNVERKMTFFRTAGGEFAALCNVTIRLIELILRLVICSISSSQTIELQGKFR